MISQSLLSAAVGLSSMTALFMQARTADAGPSGGSRDRRHSKVRAGAGVPSMRMAPSYSPSSPPSTAATTSWAWMMDPLYMHSAL